MKNLKKVGIGLLTITGLLTMTGCSTIGKIQKAFEKEGYVWKVITSKAEEKKAANEEEEEDLIDGIYYTYSLTNVFGSDVPDITSYGMIIEFNGNSAKDAIKQLKEDEDVDQEELKSLIQAYGDSEITNGNCVLLSGSDKTIEIFKNA